MCKLWTYNVGLYPWPWKEGQPWQQSSLFNYQSQGVCGSQVMPKYMNMLIPSISDHQDTDMVDGHMDRRHKCTCAIHYSINNYLSWITNSGDTYMNKTCHSPRLGQAQRVWPEAEKIIRQLYNYVREFRYRIFAIPVRCANYFIAAKQSFGAAFNAHYHLPCSIQLPDAFWTLDNVLLSCCFCRNTRISHRFRDGMQKI